MVHQLRLVANHPAQDDGVELRSDVMVLGIIVCFWNPDQHSVANLERNRKQEFGLLEAIGVV